VSDRLLATSIDARWHYPAPGVGAVTTNFAGASEAVVRTIIQTFAGPPNTGVDSPSLQHTAFEIGRAVIRAVPAVQDISLNCPNIHNIPVDFSPFPGQKNQDATGNPDVFWATKEPFGIIKVTVARDNRRRSRI